jgi:hypothetical protein
VDISCRWTTFRARTPLVYRGLNGQTNDKSDHTNVRREDKSQCSIAWVSREWPDKEQNYYFNESWCAFHHENRLMEAKQAPEARICGTRSGWRRYDAAGGWICRDYFFVPLSCPIRIHRKIFVCSWLAEVWARQCYRHLQKIPLAVPLTRQTIILRSTLSGASDETQAYPNELLR